jgi:hypothetical protein
MAVNMHAESSIRSGPVTGDGVVGFGKGSLLFRLIAAWGIFFEFHDGRIWGKTSRGRIQRELSQTDLAVSRFLRPGRTGWFEKTSKMVYTGSAGTIRRLLKQED